MAGAEGQLAVPNPLLAGVLVDLAGAGARLRLAAFRPTVCCVCCATVYDDGWVLGWQLLPQLLLAQ